MKRPSLLLVILLLWIVSLIVTAQSSRRTPKPKPTPDILSGGLVPIPEDEILFTRKERDEILFHKGWRIATRSAEDEEGTQDVLYFDRNRIQVLSNRIIRTWIRTETTRNSNKQSFVMRLEEYDCINRRARTLSETEYDKNYQVTRTSASNSFSNWDYVIPESVGERVWVILCEDKVDEEQMDFNLASKWYGDARRLEKQGDLQSALYWYEAASEHVGFNRKLSEAITRVKRLLGVK